MSFRVCLVPTQIIFEPEPMFQVLDTGEPADRHHSDLVKAECWDISKFKTMKQAIAYARDWLGIYEPGPDWKGEKYDYSGYGDTIEIVKVLNVF